MKPPFLVAFGFALDESLGTCHLKDAMEGHCLRSVSPPSCILKGIPKHLIRRIGGGVYFPHRFQNLGGRLATAATGVAALVAVIGGKGGKEEAILKN